jgi:flagellar M-ring protein FliF
MLASTTEQMSTEASISALPGAVGTAEASLAGAPDRTQIIDMARKNPDTTAVVVKQWLKNPT